MLQAGGLENFDTGQSSDNSPCSQNLNLLDGLVEVGGQGKLIDLLTPLVDPDTLRLALLRVSPCCKNLLLPSEGGGDIGGGLRASDENEVQSATKIIGLNSSANRGGNLEGCLSERNRGERNAGRRY